VNGGSQRKKLRHGKNGTCNDAVEPEDAVLLEKDVCKNYMWIL
jgi:hypothetical protein